MTTQLDQATTKSLYDRVMKGTQGNPNWKADLAALKAQAVGGNQYAAQLSGYNPAIQAMSTTPKGTPAYTEARIAAAPYAGLNPATLPPVPTQPGSAITAALAAARVSGGPE